MSSPQQAPTPFQPPNQAGSAQAFQQGAGQLSTAGTNLYNQVAPQLSTAAQGAVNNPYYGQAQAGAQAAASTATNTVAPSQFAGAAQDTGVANLASLAAPSYANAATTGGVNAANTASSLLPAATSGLSAAPGVFNQAQSAIPGATAGAQIAPGAIAQTQGFIPQGTAGVNFAPGALAQTQGLVPSTTGGAALAPDALAALQRRRSSVLRRGSAGVSAILARQGLGAAGQVLNTGVRSAGRSLQSAVPAAARPAERHQRHGAGYPARRTAPASSGQEVRAELQHQLGRTNSSTGRSPELGAYDQAASTYARRPRKPPRPPG